MKLRQGTYGGGDDSGTGKGHGHSVTQTLRRDGRQTKRHKG